MLKDCLEVFKNMYDKEGENLIVDSYSLVEGSYILVKNNGELDKLEIYKRDNDRSNKMYSYFAQRDYLSKYIDSNKAINTTVTSIDKNGKEIKIGTKVVCSNNYLTFFIKKENLTSGKINEDVIKKYYDTIESIYGVDNKEKLEFIKDWMRNNLLKMSYPEKEKSAYLKIFFEEDIETYRNESSKYIISKIYNDAKYNVEIDNKIYGLPNDNMGLNSKKPYLEQKGRKNTMPYLINEEEVLIQKKFFDFLMNNVAINKRLVYIDEKVNCYENGDRPKGKFTGYFMRLQKGKEVEIHDFDTVVSMNSKIRAFEVFKPIDIDYSKVKQVIEYKTTTDIKDVEVNISNGFFNKFLHTNYFTDAKDIKLNEGKLKEILIENRESLFNWFYKGNINGVRSNLSKYSLKIIKGSILNGYITKAAEQYNLRYSLLNYFNGGSNMGDLLKDTKNALREKINSKETQSIQSDEEYYFAIGQVANYLISLNKSGNKTHSLLNPILNTKNEIKLKEEIMKLFKKHNYAIKKDSKRFNNLYSMILGYNPENKINEDLLLAGYLNSSLIYEKVEDKGNE
ncbi:type I-B CRISPR-associated protein Cas8b/Csh1 [[Clostridium] dakarense]|uniref:type I-B CRISPR-associated protein Cas8b/Csh1 n=1 Tax=Faecalimicrobium dakarense TaxID=1301100 RepID=UPI0004B455DB|nr:type I-B CRISPR-associated protein Cas8b/Csh1 [[Clostridium] dakarense]